MHGGVETENMVFSGDQGERGLVGQLRGRVVGLRNEAFRAEEMAQQHLLLVQRTWVRFLVTTKWLLTATLRGSNSFIGPLKAIRYGTQINTCTRSIEIK